MSKRKDEDRENNRKVWESLKDHVARGEEAQQILAVVYSELGPYPTKACQISDTTRAKLNKFFDFDDSE